MTTQYKQFIPEELATDELIEKVEGDVIDNLRASLAADDDPENDDHPIIISHKRDTDILGRLGLYIIGTVESDPPPYAAPSRTEFEVPGAVATKNQEFDPTDFDSDDEDFESHMLGKVQG